MSAKAKHIQREHLASEIQERLLDLSTDAESERDLTNAHISVRIHQRHRPDEIDAICKTSWTFAYKIDMQNRYLRESPWPEHPARSVLEYIVTCLSNKWRCSWPFKVEIARACKIHRSTVPPALDELVTSGLLIIVRPRSDKSRKLFFYPTRKAIPKLHLFWDHNKVPLQRKREQLKVNRSRDKRTSDGPAVTCFLQMPPAPSRKIARVPLPAEFVKNKIVKTKLSGSDYLSLL